MTTIIVYLVILTALTPPVGAYMYRVYTRERTGRVEGVIYKLIGVDPTVEQTWRRYAACTLWFSAIGTILLYVLMRLQGHLPLNPVGVGVNQYVAFNTATSFVTNTNWQAYGGETTMSYLTQMLGLTFQNFVSAAVGMAVLIALIRGFVRSRTPGARQLLARHGARRGLHPVAARGDRRRRAHHPGSGADVLELGRGARHPGVRPDDRPRPCRVTDRHQAARHERRRILQRELRAPVRGRASVRQLRRAPLHPADPGCALLHVRQDGRQHPPGMGHLRRDDGALHRRSLVDGALRAHLLAGDACRRRLRSGPEHGGEGGPVRHRPVVALGGRHHGRVERQRELDARLLQARQHGRPDVQPRRGRGDLGRCRERPVRHALLRHHRGLHRRPDGRAHPRVPREEDRRSRGQARRSRSSCRSWWCSPSRRWRS